MIDSSIEREERRKGGKKGGHNCVKTASAWGKRGSEGGKKGGKD